MICCCAVLEHRKHNMQRPGGKKVFPCLGNEKCKGFPDSGTKRPDLRRPEQPIEGFGLLFRALGTSEEF